MIVENEKHNPLFRLLRIARDQRLGVGMLPQPSRPESAHQKQQARCGISKLGPQAKAALELRWIRPQRSLNRLPDLRSVFRAPLRRIHSTNIAQQLAEFLIRSSTLLARLK